jgi:serine kinase of HPr protein (carbohydrate metabolism regulator)
MSKRRGTATSGNSADQNSNDDDVGNGVGIAGNPPLFLHASAVRWLDKGILLLGRSASGKSDLALRLIDAGAMLIADDQVGLRRVGDRLFAEPPSKLAGLLELRGLGIMRVSFDTGFLHLAVDLRSLEPDDERLPDPMFASWLGVRLPRISIDARASSAVARIKMALVAERVF